MFDLATREPCICSRSSPKTSSNQRCLCLIHRFVLEKPETVIYHFLPLSRVTRREEVPFVDEPSSVYIGIFITGNYAVEHGSMDARRAALPRPLKRETFYEPGQLLVTLNWRAAIQNNCKQIHSLFIYIKHYIWQFFFFFFSPTSIERSLLVRKFPQHKKCHIFKHIHPISLVSLWLIRCMKNEKGKRNRLHFRSGVD